MGAFVDPSNATLVGETIEIGLTKKVRIPIFVPSDYRLGYIFGAFLSCGIANLTDYKKSTRGITIFRPKRGYQYNFDKLQKYIKEVFLLNSSLRGTDGLYVYNIPMTRMFRQFGIRKGRHLPKKYRVNNLEFNRGIIDGIDDFHGIAPDLYNEKTYKKRIVTPYVKELYEEIKIDELGL